MNDVVRLQQRAGELAPWRYDHSHNGVTIKGDPIAAPIHGALGRGHDIMQELVRGVIGDRNPAGLRALDLGCLEGHYTEILAEAGVDQIVAVEWSKDHVRRARFLLNELKGYANVSVREGDVEDPDLWSDLGAFDIVLFHGLLYHMRNPISVLERIRQAAPAGKILHLLLGTQFKFPFSEIADPSPMANLKIRGRPVDTEGRVTNEDRSTFAPVAMRLNPAAVHGLLRTIGYQDAIAYDTPLGARYGFQVNLVATTGSDPDLRQRLTANSSVPGVKFHTWNGRRLDGYDLDNRISRAVCGAQRLVRRTGELFGGSQARLRTRRTISRSGTTR